MITLDNTKKKYDFSKFRLQVARNSLARAPLTENAYFRWGYRSGQSVSQTDFTLEEINEIIRSGDLESYRELSNFYYRTNGDYKNNIDFLAVLPLYDTVVIPVLKEGKGSQTQILKDFDKACAFVEKLDVPNTFTHITKEWLKVGIYNGILRTDGEDVVIQDLPLSYCRTRFKDFNNLPILEFNLHYFEKFFDNETQKEAVSTFPEIVQKAWAAWILSKKKIDPWVMIPAVNGGVCFTFIDDQAPQLIASIPQLKKLEDAVGREEKRDENELYKLLIQKMPIDSKGELVFQLDEVAEIHASVAAMLGDIDTVDVLTTFGDTDLESLQENSAATQSNDRIKKYRDNAYDFLGRSSLLFNADGSSALSYTIKKDEALMISYLNQYETWIKFHLNDRFARTGLSFDLSNFKNTISESLEKNAVSSVEDYMDVLQETTESYYKKSGIKVDSAVSNEINDLIYSQTSEMINKYQENVMLDAIKSVTPDMDISGVYKKVKLSDYLAGTDTPLPVQDISGAAESGKNIKDALSGIEDKNINITVEASDAQSVISTIKSDLESISDKKVKQPNTKRNVLLREIMKQLGLP